MNESYKSELNELKNEEQALGYEQFGGYFLLLLGGIFLLIQFGGASFLGGKTWLLFLLIPVYWVGVSSYRQYVNNGRQLDAKVFMPFLFGLLPFVLVFAVTILPISWGSIWPIFLILAGIAAIVNNR